MTSAQKHKAALKAEHDGLIDGYFHGQRGKNMGLMGAAEDLEVIINFLLGVIDQIGFPLDDETKKAVHDLSIKKAKAVYVHDLDEALLDAHTKVDKKARLYGEDSNECYEVKAQWPDKPVF